MSSIAKIISKYSITIHLTILIMVNSMAMNNKIISNIIPKIIVPKPPNNNIKQVLIKVGFHIRNKHRNRYDFQYLKSINPELGSFVAVNKYGDESIEFSNPLAVLSLNKVNKGGGI